MTECQLVIDFRERRAQNQPLAELLGRYKEWKPGQLGKADLGLGDAVIINTAKQQIRAVYERKQISDLIASINDKRLVEQEARLIETKRSDPGTVYGVIIEGELSEETELGRHNALHIQHLIWDLATVDLLCIRTKTLQETADYLCYMRHSYSNEPSLEAAQDDLILSVSHYVGRKKSLTPENILPEYLKMIPGVTGKRAKAIADRYGSLRNLMSELEAQPMLLKGLEFDEGHRIGKALAQKIRQFLLQH